MTKNILIWGDFARGLQKSKNMSDQVDMFREELRGTRCACVYIDSMQAKEFMKRKDFTFANFA